MSLIWTPWTQTLLVTAIVFAVLAAAYSFAKFEMLMRAARSGAAGLSPEEKFRLQIARRFGLGSARGDEFCIVLIEPCPGAAPGGTPGRLAESLRAIGRRSDDLVSYDDRTLGAILDVTAGHLPRALQRWQAAWTASAAAAGFAPEVFAGCARFPVDGDSAEALTAAAVQALERARAAGPSALASCAGPATAEVGATDPSEAALVDPLTGILRPERMAGAARKFLARGRRLGRPVTVMHAGIDRMQDVNDRFGREAGDAVLKAMGGILSRELRETDLVGRAGGDDFLALVECGVEESKKAADRVIARVRETQVPAGMSVIRFTVSVGLAGETEEGVPPHLLRAAETAMHAARHEGRNLHRVYRRSLEAATPAPDVNKDIF